MSEKKPFHLTNDPFLEGSEGEPGGYDEMLPGGICHYDGPEANLPLGGYTNVPGWGPEKAARRWEVDAPDTDGGKIYKATKDLLPTDFITGVELNQNTLRGHSYLIREANGSQLMTPDQWFKQFGTDGMGLVAIRNMRQILAGKKKMIHI